MTQQAHTLTCKYCGTSFTVRCKPEELRFYMKCCKPCWDNDEPGMARFNRMADMMGERWALGQNAYGDTIR